jgi:hypothetical protein
MRKKVISVIGVVIIFILAISAAIRYGFKIDDKGKLFDDDQYIIAEGTSFSFFSKTGSDDQLQFEKFSGTYLLDSFADGSEIEIDLSIQINKGRFKVVLIDPNDQIIDLTSGINKISTITGEYRIKMVGDNAYGSIVMDIEVSESEAS